MPSRCSNAVVLILSAAVGVAAFASSAAAQAGWTPLTLPTTETLRSVHVVSPTEGWAAGYNGTIIHTADGGANWTSQPTNTTLRFLAVHFVDANNGWALAGRLVLHTTDGGVTWVDTLADPSVYKFRNALWPSSATQAWVPAVSSGVPTQTRWFSRYTVQGNGTVLEEDFNVTVSTSSFLDIHCTDADNCWSVSSAGQIVRISSASGGAPSFAYQTSGVSSSLNGLFMLDATHGWIVGNTGKILKTTNGTDWTALVSGTTTNLKEVCFVDLNRGWAVGESGTILATTDGGATWIAQSSGVTTTLWSVHLVPFASPPFRGVTGFISGGDLAGGTNGVVLRMEYAKPAAPGDVDGDGQSDAVVWRASTGTWYARHSGTGGATYTAMQWGDQASGDVPVPGDYDGDGKMDLAVWRPASGTWYILKSSDNYATSLSAQWGDQASGDVPVPGDYDGDGRTDVAVWRASAGTWYILRSTDNYSYATSLSYQWGDQGAGDVPVPGDYDGDGAADLAVWRPSSGTWYILKSTDGYSYATYLGIQWGDGTAGDVPVPGDYDGDSKTDLAVWRPGTGTWYILKSTDAYGYGTYLGIQWGDQADGDVPVPGDYDGDGTTDLAVWRAGPGIWFILQSSDNYNYATYLATQWGVETDVPVSILTAMLGSMPHALKITTAPPSQVVTEGQTVNFNVAATGTGALSYAWKHNGRLLAGATAATLHVPGVTYRDRGYYEVIVTDSAGSVSAFFHVNVKLRSGRLNVWTTQRTHTNPAVAVPLAGTEVTAIAANRSHSLALAADGTVAGWGSGDAAVVPPGLVGVVAIAAGGQHSMALTSEGTVVGWGGTYGTPPEGLSGVVAISAGVNHSLALKSDGTVAAWGWGTAAVVPPDLTGVVAIAAGGMHNLALKADGMVVAWGDDTRGQCDVPGDLSDVVAIAAGIYHSLALTADGTVVAWGDDSWGEATVPEGLANVVEVAAGSYAGHSVAVRSDGTAVAWGLNSNGQATVPGGTAGIADAAGAYEYTLVLASNLVSFSGRMVEAGTLVTLEAPVPDGGPFTYAWTRNGQAMPGATGSTVTLPAVAYADRGAYKVVVKESGVVAAMAVFFLNVRIPSPTIAAWGSNAYGQTSVPADVGDVVAVSAGLQHSMALRSDGTVKEWGNLSAPQPSGLRDVVAIAGGVDRTVALKSDGTVVAWGYNQPAVPAGLSNVVAVAAGYGHNLALKVDGTVVGWGDDSYGQCDLPAGLSDVVAVSAIYLHSLALKADGTVVAWGYNAMGQAEVPPGLSDVSEVAAGFGHNLVRQADGSVLAWGTNYIEGLNLILGPSAGVIAVAPGSWYIAALALKADGTVLTWANSYDHGEPGTLPDLHDVVAIRTAEYHSLVLYSGGL